MKRRSVGLVTGVLLLLTAGQAVAWPILTRPRQESEAPSAKAQPEGGDGRRTLRHLPVNLLRGVGGVFSRDSLLPAVIGGAAAGLGAELDGTIADRIADPDNGFGQSFETGGSPLLLSVAVTGVFVGGRLAEGTRFRAASYDLLGAFVVNLGYTGLLKELVGRERPDGSDKLSMPSGHASNAFALAVVLERHYGWKAGVPAYTLASAVALSRLQRNKHYLSDVLVGGTLGYLVGRAVVRVNGAPERPAGQISLSIAPVLGRETRGLSVMLTF